MAILLILPMSPTGCNSSVALTLGWMELVPLYVCLLSMAHEDGALAAEHIWIRPSTLLKMVGKTIKSVGFSHMPMPLDISQSVRVFPGCLVTKRLWKPQISCEASKQASRVLLRGTTVEHPIARQLVLPFHLTLQTKHFQHASNG